MIKANFLDTWQGLDRLPKALAHIHTAGGFRRRRFSSAAFWVRDGKTKVPGSNPSSRKTNPPSKAVNKESKHSRVCGARFFVVTFSRTDFWHAV
jgi:hypothetical protein